MLLFFIMLLISDYNTGSSSSKQDSSFPLSKIQAKERWMKISCRIKSTVRWRLIARSVENIMGNYKACNGCFMSLKYWTEFQTIYLHSMAIHPYPQKLLMESWIKEGYSNFSSFLLKYSRETVPQINVIYFDKKALLRYEVSLHKGIFYREGMQIPKGRYLFVLTMDNKLYIARKGITEQGLIQHSSFSGGKPVRSCGLIEINDHGQVVKISNHSGHYHPKEEQVSHIMEYFQEFGISLDTLSVNIFTKSVEYSAKSQIFNNIFQLQKQFPYPIF